MNKYKNLKTGVGKPCCYCRRVMVKADSDEGFDNPGLIVSIEHKMYPRSKGGTSAAFNLDHACRRCNNLRANIDIKLWEPFARVVIQQHPNIPDPVLREALRNYIYHLAELSISNTQGIKAATLATLIDVGKQVSSRDLAK